MAFLSGVWLSLLVKDLGWGLGRFGQNISYAIWIIFVLEFLLRIGLAPRKIRYIRRNWLTAVSLLLPALRVFRFARIFRILARMRGMQLVRILGSINRGMKTLGRNMKRRGFGYVVALTVVVTLTGAAGMFYFERSLPDGEGMHSFWTALWWTAMIMTTMGSEYWPKTPEGRALCLLLAIYAFSIFGYFTGTIATYFIGQDTVDEEAKRLSRSDLDALRAEISLLRKELRDRQT